MKDSSRRDLLVNLGALLGMSFLGSKAFAEDFHDGSKALAEELHDPRAIIDMPVSLGINTVRTPEFSVERKCLYHVRLRFEHRIPYDGLRCMTGLSLIPCDKESLLHVNWTVRKGAEIVRQGSSQGNPGGGVWDAAGASVELVAIFNVTPGTDYTVELSFVKDGSALNVTHPRLLIILVKPHDFIP